MKIKQTANNIFMLLVTIALITLSLPIIFVLGLVAKVSDYWEERGK
jgi:hypothetical protein